MEKLFMCFAIHQCMDVKNRFIVKGGMAALLNSMDQGIVRLSEDIDMMTELSLADIKDAMNEVGGHDGISYKMYTPPHPRPVDNLATFDIYYESCFDGKPSNISADITYLEPASAIRTKTMPSGSVFLGMDLAAPVTYMDRGPPSVDKLLTLAFDSIGMRPRPSGRMPDTPKQGLVRKST